MAWPADADAAAVGGLLLRLLRAAAHDGTLPFTGSVVSYKSSTTESSGMDGAEEDTISCRVAGAAAAAAGGSSSSRGGCGCVWLAGWLAAQLMVHQDEQHNSCPDC
jgi:hypothetical protein